jgi:hypothetical protein
VIPAAEVAGAAAEVAGAAADAAGAAEVADAAAVADAVADAVVEGVAQEPAPCAERLRLPGPPISFRPSTRPTTSAMARGIAIRAARAL